MGADSAKDNSFFIGGLTMSTNLETARQFFEACDTGKGWEACSENCHSDATFSSQTAVLADISSLEGYCEWMKNLLTPIPDGHYELKFFGADESSNSVAAFAVFHGTQTGPGGRVNRQATPLQPTMFTTWFSRMAILSI